MSDNENSQNENENSSDETASYSEEEVMDIDAGDGEMENRSAIDAILEENDRLEAEENAFLVAKRSKAENSVASVETKRSGKQKAEKTLAASDNSARMWKELKRLKLQLSTMKDSSSPMKRPRQNEIPSNSKGESSAKKKKVGIDVESNSGAFDRPGPSGNKQLSSAKTNTKQLSSATLHQLSSVKTNTQLSQSAQTSQLRSATATSNTVTHNSQEEDDVSLHESENDEDPLRAEAEEIQRNIDPPNPDNNDDDENLTSDEEGADDEDQGEDMFADLVGGVSIEGDKEQPGPPIMQIWADKINLAWKTKLNKLSHTHMLQKYKIASNLKELKVPSVNKEIWKPLNKWQKKADLNMTSCQRSLIGVVSAVLKLHDYVSILP